MKKIVSWFAIILLSLAVYLNVFYTLGSIESTQEDSFNDSQTKEHVDVKQKVETIQHTSSSEKPSVLSW